MTRSRIADLGHRVLPAVIVLAGMAVMGLAIVETFITKMIDFGPIPELGDDSGMNARIRWACVPIVAAAVWTLLTRRPWWVPAALAAPVFLVAMPTLVQEVPRNAVPIYGFVPAALLVLAGVVGNAMGPRPPR